MVRPEVGISQLRRLGVTLQSSFITPKVLLLHPRIVVSNCKHSYLVGKLRELWPFPPRSQWSDHLRKQLLLQQNQGRLRLFKGYGVSTELGKHCT